MRRVQASPEVQGDLEGPSALETRRVPDLPSVPAVPLFLLPPLIPALPWGPRLHSDLEVRALRESLFYLEDHSRHRCLWVLE